MRAHRSRPDVLAGAIVIVTGGAFAAGALGHDLGTPPRLGPGAFPRPWPSPPAAPVAWTGPPPSTVPSTAEKRATWRDPVC
ncbi:hypothetical protein [Nonomuraea sp. NPDC049309]|uniref:hypothetical protein n=1 Tax=Nonomuraea sp. NPDC049309 TaxID=3364350 RepID=UPI0037119B4A